ncbi:c24-sterol methyltransferase [Coccidioides posadasii str. Silveira]|uniref:C24-sterol methyltransferase n=1 Tax=Coccidioides posadasii (strain RMSCC 757 / Silveira) TaxID=443226 RepID=E9CU16_COCPS|nr:c24-sterol methyltransferase [Coccidioides posadasii str. Silveira]
MPSLPSQDREEDRFTPAVEPMHAKSAEERNAFLSMLKKDSKSHREITNSYLNFWQADGGKARDDTEDERDGRISEYMSLVSSYYDLATDIYEEAWAQSFHLCRFAIGEPLQQALARHEHYLASREMATFTGCNVVGLNNNGYQIQRAKAHAERERLSHKVSFVKGDFRVCCRVYRFTDKQIDILTKYFTAPGISRKFVRRRVGAKAVQGRIPVRSDQSRNSQVPKTSSLGLDVVPVLYASNISGTVGHNVLPIEIWEADDERRIGGFFSCKVWQARNCHI